MTQLENKVALIWVAQVMLAKVLSECMQRELTSLFLPLPQPLSDAERGVDTIMLLTLPVNFIINLDNVGQKWVVRSVYADFECFSTARRSQK